MIDDFYEASEYPKSVYREEKPVYTKETCRPAFPVENPLSRPLLNGDSSQVGRNYSRLELNPTAELWYAGPPRDGDLIGPQQLQQVLGQQQDALYLHVIAYSLLQALKMPKRELLTFDGNNLNYWQFVNNFEGNIAKGVPVAESQLTYLFQHCTGKANEAINNCCIIYPPEHGYKKAQVILYRRYHCARVYRKDSGWSSVETYGCRWFVRSVCSDAELCASSRPDGLRSTHKQLRQSCEDNEAPPCPSTV